MAARAQPGLLDVCEAGVRAMTAVARTVDSLAERLQRARVNYELRPSPATWTALLEAENAWLRQALRDAHKASMAGGGFVAGEDGGTMKWPE